MAKPIFTVGLPYSIYYEMGEITINDVHESVSNIIGDEYYTLAYVLPDGIDDYKLQVFYEKDFDEVKYEELNKIIMDNLKSIEKN